MSIQLQEISAIFISQNRLESGTVEDTRLHQIYTNKLVEGKDYMVGEWLKGDGNATITHKDVDTFEVKVLQLDIAVSYAFGYYKNNSNLTATLFLNKSTAGSNYSGLVLRRIIDSGVLANYRTPSSNINLGEHIITKNTQTDQIGVFTDSVRHIKNATSDRDYVGTDIIFNKLIPSQNLYIGYLSSPNIHNLVPCRLLRPIPRNLDAQCKSRVTGECGMIDLVSGRFYGNVADSGAFSLEWDEWLKDCSIQIAIPSCYAFKYTTRVDTTKLTSELVDFGIIKLSNTQIVYGDEDDGHVYTVDWGTNKWATLGINVMSGYRTVTISLNGSTVGTSYGVLLDRNPHIYLFDIMQIKQIDWTIMVESTATTTTLTRYVDESTGQQGLISDQDGTIIYAD